MSTMTETRERAVTFRAEEVQATLAGRKTRHRIPLRHQPHESEHRPGEWLVWERRNTYATNARYREVFKRDGGGETLESSGEYLMPVADWLLERSPFKVGMQLWVRETWQAWTEFDAVAPTDIPSTARARINFPTDGNVWDAKLRPSIHMPRWASRITLDITAVRVERLQDITHRDCCAEGWPGQTEVLDPSDTTSHFADATKGDWINAIGDGDDAAIEWYADLWESIHGAGSWDANPWVWVVTFAPARPAEQETP